MYDLNVNDAKAAEQIGRFISETGKYQGTLVRAEVIKSTQGTDGVEFTFISDDGREADFLQLWTAKADGTRLHGFKVLMALMACCGIRNLTPLEMVVKKWDPNAHAKVETKIKGFPGLTGKKVGLLLQKELYNKNNGKEGYKMNIYAPFQYETELTASEILDRKSQPVALGKLVSILQDRDNRKASSANNSGYGFQSAAPAGTDPLDDDIPF